MDVDEVQDLSEEELGQVGGGMVAELADPEIA